MRSCQETVRKHKMSINVVKMTSSWIWIFYLISHAIMLLKRWKHKKLKIPVDKENRSSGLFREYTLKDRIARRKGEAKKNGWREKNTITFWDCINIFNNKRQTTYYITKYVIVQLWREPRRAKTVTVCCREEEERSKSCEN